MNLALSISLLTLALLSYVFWAGTSKPTSNNKRQHQREGKALIALYERDKATALKLPASEQSQALAELDRRLHQALSNLERDNNPDNLVRGLPWWSYVLTLGTIVAALVFWYGLTGGLVWQWSQLEHKLQPELLRGQYLGEIPAYQPQQLATYCLALQSRLDRQDQGQLQTLARCYESYGNTSSAYAIYRHLYRQNDNDTDIALHYARLSIMAQKSMSADIEAILVDLRRDDPHNYLASLFLATGYNQSNRQTLAQPIWQTLAQQLPLDHPLRPLVMANIAPTATPPSPLKPPVSHHSQAPTTNPPTPASSKQSSITVNIRIAPELLAQLPPSAKLFVLASPAGQRMPIVVSADTPQAQQQIILSDHNSMQGQTLAQHQRLDIRAILSTDGNADGTRLTDDRSTTIDHSPNMQVDFSFESSP